MQEPVAHDERKVFVLTSVNAVRACGSWLLHKLLSWGTRRFLKSDAHQFHPLLHQAFLHAQLFGDFLANDAAGNARISHHNDGTVNFAFLYSLQSSLFYAIL